MVLGPLRHLGTLFLEDPPGQVPSTSGIISPVLLDNPISTGSFPNRLGVAQRVEKLKDTVQIIYEFGFLTFSYHRWGLRPTSGCGASKQIRSCRTDNARAWKGWAKLVGEDLAGPGRPHFCLSAGPKDTEQAQGNDMYKSAPGISGILTGLGTKWLALPGLALFNTTIPAPVRH